jgi:heme/copper-type cytochrome/quinol oxidase subunit 4
MNSPYSFDKKYDPYDEPMETAEVNISTANRKVYNGMFNDGHGHPNVRFYGYILEELVPLFGLYLVITQKYKYAVYFIIFFALGSILNGIRFYYVNPFSEGLSDAEYLNYIVYQNIFNAIICIIAILYLLFIKK